MKKYKLIKEYPGSPSLNTNVTIDETGYNCLNCSNDLKPEKYPEFWQLVVEKDYEILSLIVNKDYNTLYKGDIVTKKKNDWIGISKDNKTICFSQNNNTLEEYDHWSINSIKRLSDGEIFTIGDKIGTPGRIFPIVEFKIYNNENTILISSYFNKHGSGRYNQRLKDLKKIKQPLFTTEDGVEIYEGNIYYKVVNDTFQLLIMENASKGESLKSKVFSTKEKAEEYIIMNKPCLSINEILNLYKGQIIDFTLKPIRIKNLVKTKLKND